MAQIAKPREDKEFQNHDPEAIPGIMGPHDFTCGAMTEVRHDHHIFGPEMRWECTRRGGHLGRHAASYGSGIAASWAQKV